MNYDQDTLDKNASSIESYGEKVSSLLGLGEHPRNIPFAAIEKKMLGAKGELFLKDRYVGFRSNGGFNRLKERTDVPYSEVTGLRTNSSSHFIDWKFTGSAASFKVGLVFYGRVKGINPRDIFWYELEEFPRRSGAFYSLVSVILPQTGLASDLKPAAVRRTLRDALEYFLGTRSIDDSGLKDAVGNSLYPEYSVMVEAFTRFLAGTAGASAESAGAFLDIFRDLDGIFADMVSHLRESMAGFNPGRFAGDRQVYDMGEKFERLSTIWYLRQIAALHFAGRHLGEEETKAWPIKILKPRAVERMSNNRRTVSIDLPGQEVFDETLKRLGR